MCWNRAMSHLSLPMFLIEKYLVIAVFLKVYNIDNLLLLTTACTIGTMAVLYVGHLDIKHNIYALENTITNKHNPELMYLVNRNKRRK